jgi:AraC-like DNA-binding protein
MNFSQPLVDRRSAAFARLASRVLEALNEAVDHRKEEGKTLTELADSLGCHRSVLTRVLNGTSSNLTLRTISDVLWAADYDPQDFKADPIESICSNGIGVDDQYVGATVSYPTKTIVLNPVIEGVQTGSAYRKPQLEMSLR